MRLLVPRTDPQVPVNPARGLISILTARSLPPFPRTLISRRSRSSSTAATRRTGGLTDARSRRRFRNTTVRARHGPLTQRPGLAAKCHRATYRNEKRLLGILRSHITLNTRVIRVAPVFLCHALGWC